VIRAADNGEATVDRVRLIQRSPEMLEALGRMFEKGQPIVKAIKDGEIPEMLQRPGEEKKAYKARLAAYMKDRLKKITDEYMVTPKMVEDVRSGRKQRKDLPKFARGQTLEDALLASELLDRLNDGTFPHFKGCETLNKLVITEMPGTDGRLMLEFKFEMNENMDGTPVATDLNVRAGGYQLARALDAFGSLYYDRRIGKKVVYEKRDDDLKVPAQGIKIRFAVKRRPTAKEEEPQQVPEKRGKVARVGRETKYTFGMPKAKLEDGE
jgi:hypothetical protein